MADEPLQNQNDAEPVHRIPSADSVADAFAEFELMPHEKTPQAAPAVAPAAPAPVPAAAVKPPRPPVPPAAPPVQPIPPVPQPKTQAPEETTLPKIVVMPKGPPAKAPEPPRAAPAPEVLPQKQNVPPPPRPDALPPRTPANTAAPLPTPPLPPTPKPPVTPAAASPVAPLASAAVPRAVAPAPLSAPAPASAPSPSPLSAAARPAPRPETSLMDQALAAKLPDKLPPRMPEAPMGKLTEDLPLGVHVQEAPKLVGQESAPQGPALGQKPVPPVPAKKPSVSVVESLKEQAQSPLHPLRTLRLDVEESVKERKTSLVSVAAAEEDRRAKAETAPSLVEEEIVEQKPKRSRAWLVAVVSIVFLLGGLGALAYVFLPRVTAPAKPQSPTLPASTVIFVDEVVQVPLDGKGHTEALSAFSSLRDSTKLSLGLIRELYPTVTATTTGVLSRVSAPDLMRIMAPSASDELLRTLDPLYVLGAHVFDGNQAFLILKTNAYEQAYSGLIAWEPSMRGELLPLFDRRPRPRGPGEQLSTTSAPSVIQTGFSDAVIENHDARVYKDADGNVVLLWTFVDRSTIVITTNDRTLREIITRLRHAPIQGF